MPRRVGIFGVSEESMQLLRLLACNPQLELAGVFADDEAAARRIVQEAAPEVELLFESLLTLDADAFFDGGSLHAVVEGGASPGFAARFPGASEQGLQILSPLTARLLWGYETATRDRKSELLTALSEVVESVELTIDSQELFARMLEIAVGVTGAEGGSLMLLDPARRELTIRVAIGVERELWPKIRVPIGEGIAGRVAQDARPLLVNGRADRSAFQIVRERMDVESALSVPLVSDGGVLGVLNLHHGTRRNAFDDDDLRFMERVARLDAQIITRAEEHERLRNQAARYDAVRTVHEILGDANPLLDRLRALCLFVAERVGHGIVNVYLDGSEDGELRLAATSLEGGGFGGEYRVVAGHGIDGQVARSRRPAFLRGEDGSLAYVSLPLLSADRLVGVLGVQCGATPPRGRGAEETLLELPAATADGIAQSERETRMATRANRINAINETGIRMISSKQLSEVVRLATSSVAMILEADHAILRLQDEETKRFVIRSYFGGADGQVQERLFKLDKQVCVETIRRRTAFRVTDLRESPGLAEWQGEFQSCLCAPLRRADRVVGTLSVYDKVVTDHFYAGAFDEDDLQVFTKFLGYVERGVEGALAHSAARQQRSFDEETGLPNAGYLGTRVQEEIARARGSDGALALASCRIENLDEIAAQAGPAHAHRVTLRAAQALREQLRDFDVLGRTAPGEFSMLLPDPGANPGERVFELARSVADDLSKDPALNQPLPVALAFGYAMHPADGSDRESLLAAAAEPRIRLA